MSSCCCCFLTGPTRHGHECQLHRHGDRLLGLYPQHHGQHLPPCEHHICNSHSIWLFRIYVPFGKTRFLLERSTQTALTANACHEAGGLGPSPARGFLPSLLLCDVHSGCSTCWLSSLTEFSWNIGVSGSSQWLSGAVGQIFSSGIKERSLDYVLGPFVFENI